MRESPSRFGPSDLEDFVLCSVWAAGGSCIVGQAQGCTRAAAGRGQGPAGYSPTGGQCHTGGSAGIAAGG